MEITKVRFYTNGNLRREKDELKYCSVTFDNGIKINDIVIKEYEGQIFVRLPKRSAIKRNSEERYRYQIIGLSNELYHQVKQAVLDQWERYTSKRQEKPA